MGTKEFNMSGFSSINVRFAMEIEIIRADSYNVTVTGSDSLINNIEVRQDGEKLILGYNLNLVSFFTAPFTRAHARITLPRLCELNVTGAAHGTVKGFASQDDFNLYVSGASRLDVIDMSVGNMKWEFSGASRINGQIEAAGTIDLNVNGASKIELKGSALDINVHATGASHIDLSGFQVRNANIIITGASRSAVNLNGKLDAMLEGASNLEYRGLVTLGEVKVAGASTFKKK